MTVIYDGKHSINFFNDLKAGSRLDGKHNTWIDWHLIPTKKPYIAPAQPEFRLMRIPASNAVMDISDYYAGGMRYSMRSGEWEFLVDLNYWKSSNDALSYFLANLHGKKLYCELTDAPGTAYCGRFSVTSYESSSSYPIMRVSYQIFPTVSLAGEIAYDEESDEYVIRYDESDPNIDSDDVVIDVEDFVEPEDPGDSDEPIIEDVDAVVEEG